MSESKKTVLDYDQLIFSKHLQARDGVNRERAENIGSAVKRGEEIERLEVYEIDDETDTTHHGGCYVTDGHTRGVGYEIAGKKKAIPVIVHKGTWRDAMRAASMANKSWDTLGLPRSNKDKERAVIMYAKSYEGLPKKLAPSNRQTATDTGTSPGFVDRIDPYGRGKSGSTSDDVDEVKNRKKPGKKAMKAADGDTPLPNANSALAFDFKQYQDHLKWMVSAFLAMGETFGIQKEGDYVLEEKNLNEFLEYISDQKQRFGKKTKRDNDRQAIAQVAASFNGKAAAKKKSKKKPVETGEVDEDGFPVSYDEPDDVERQLSEADTI